MKNLTLIGALALSLSLSGCASFSMGGLFGGSDVEEANHLNSTVINKDRMVYPNLPDLDVPSLSTTLPFEWVHPKTKDGEEVMRGNANRCLAPDGWLQYQLNFAHTKEYIHKLIARIEIVNKQRAKWRELNDSTGSTSPKK